MLESNPRHVRAAASCSTRRRLGCGDQHVGHPERLVLDAVGGEGMTADLTECGPHAQ